MPFQGISSYKIYKIHIIISFTCQFMVFRIEKKAMPSECSSDNSIIFAIVSFYKYVSLQYCYERTRAQMQKLGNKDTPTIVTCRSVGGETRARTGSRVSSGSCDTSHEFIERVKGMVSLKVILRSILRSTFHSAVRMEFQKCRN